MEQPSVNTVLYKLSTKDERKVKCVKAKCFLFLLFNSAVLGITFRCSGRTTGLAVVLRGEDRQAEADNCSYYRQIRRWLRYCNMFQASMFFCTWITRKFDKVAYKQKTLKIMCLEILCKYPSWFSHFSALLVILFIHWCRGFSSFRIWNIEQVFD